MNNNWAGWVTEPDSVGFMLVALAVTNCWVCCSLQSTELSRTWIPSEYPSLHFIAVTLSAWLGSFFPPFHFSLRKKYIINPFIFRTFLSCGWLLGMTESKKEAWGSALCLKWDVSESTQEAECVTSINLYNCQTGVFMNAYYAWLLCIMHVESYKVHLLLIFI